MSAFNQDEVKIEIIVNAVMRLMLQIAPHGYTFDSVKLQPYTRTSKGICYELWVHDAEGKRVLGHSEEITIFTCHGKKVEA